VRFGGGPQLPYSLRRPVADVVVYLDAERPVNLHDRGRYGRCFKRDDRSLGRQVRCHRKSKPVSYIAPNRTILPKSGFRWVAHPSGFYILAQPKNLSVSVHSQVEVRIGLCSKKSPRTIRKARVRPNEDLWDIFCETRSPHRLRFLVKLSPNSALLAGTELESAAENLSNAPGLGDASSRSERWLSVEDFADRADTRFAHFSVEIGENDPARLPVVRVCPEPCIEVGSDKPRPDRSLMVGCIAHPEIAIVANLIVRVAWCE